MACTLKSVKFALCAGLLVSNAVATAQTAASTPQNQREFHIAKYENTRNKAYCEVFLVRKPSNPAEIDADVYNSTPFNDCPRDQFAALSPQILAQDHGAFKAILNQRRFWMPDTYTFYQAAEAKTFGGIKMEWLAVLRVPPGLSADARSKAYQPATIARDSEKRYLKGKPVFELVAPDGVVWVMQSAIDKPLPLDNLSALTDQLKLPDGWSFRVRILARDLIMRTKPVADILQDAMLNVYEGCTRDVCREE